MPLLLEDELPTINDTLLSKQSARKGRCTTILVWPTLLNCPCLTLMTFRKAGHCPQESEKFEIIQAWFEQVANPEESKSDEATLEDQRAGISTVRKMMESTLKAHEFHVKGKCLYEDLDEFADCQEFSNPQVFTLLQSFEQ